MKKPFYLLLILATAISCSYIIGVKIGQLPENIYQAPFDDENLIKWEEYQDNLSNSIVSASIVGNSSDQLYVYIDYIYSGEHGDTVTSCGEINRYGYPGDWACAPVGVGSGRGFVTLNFSLADDSTDIVCSNEIVISFYNSNGKTFFKKAIPYNKTWVKNRSEVSSKLRELISRCPQI